MAFGITRPHPVTSAACATTSNRPLSIDGNGKFPALAAGSFFCFLRQPSAAAVSRKSPPRSVLRDACLREFSGCLRKRRFCLFNGILSVLRRPSPVRLRDRVARSEKSPASGSAGSGGRRSCVVYGSGSVSRVADSKDSEIPPPANFGPNYVLKGLFCDFSEYFYGKNSMTGNFAVLCLKRERLLAKEAALLKIHRTNLFFYHTVDVDVVDSELIVFTAGFRRARRYCEFYSYGFEFSSSIYCELVVCGRGGQCFGAID